MTAVFEQPDPAALAAALVAGGLAILQYLGRCTVAIHDDLDDPWIADVDERVLWINEGLDPEHYGAAIADGMVVYRAKIQKPGSHVMDHLNPQTMGE